MITLSEPESEAIKVSIIGMGGVSKTEVLKLICGREIDLEYIPKINVDLASYDGFEDIPRSIVFWDFAGQSNFRSLWKSLLDSTDIALLVLDSTFENVNYNKHILRDIFDEFPKKTLVIGIANYQNKPNRLTPEFCESWLANSGRIPPIRVYGIDTDNPDCRDKLLTILREAIKKVITSQ